MACPHFSAAFRRHTGCQLARCISLGIIAATLDGLPQLNPNIKLLLITGFLGSMTTLSGVSLEITGMLQSQRWLTALATASLHLFGSLLLTFLGITTVNLFRQ